MSSFTVEMATGKNQNPVFKPINMVLRGRWDRSKNTHASMHQAIAAVGDLPGLYITVNTLTKTLSVTDPLFLPEYQGAWEAFRTAQSKSPDAINESKRLDPIVYEDATDDDIKTWVYWVRRLLDNKKCVVVSGSVPKWDEIREMPGEAKNEIGATITDSRASDRRAMRRGAVAAGNQGQRNEKTGK